MPGVGHDAEPVPRSSTIVLALASLSLATCSRDDGRVQLRVFAASSLTEAFTDIEAAFEAAHPDVDVVLAFAGSQVLRLQIEQGAPADVFASANLEHARALADAGLVEAPQHFADNALTILVPADNPAGIERFDQLPRAERLVLGTEAVPVGAYARQALARAGDDFQRRVLARVVSEEANVRLVRAKVELGEADAAIVYASDAIGSSARAIAIPEAVDVRVGYSIAIVANTRQRARAEQWVAFVRGPASRAILADHGLTVGE